jgi:hypothetical protein
MARIGGVLDGLSIAEGGDVDTDAEVESKADFEAFTGRLFSFLSVRCPSLTPSKLVLKTFSLGEN